MGPVCVSLQRGCERRGALSPSLTRAVLFTPQIIRVQSPEGVKRITATKRETVATFLKKVPAASPRGQAASGSSHAPVAHVSPHGADALVAARIAVPAGKGRFYWCS